MSAGGGGEDIQLWHAELRDREHGDDDVLATPCQASWGLCWTLPV